MYSVSAAFREAMLNPAQEHRVTGTIGNLSFDESNLVEGSFRIQKQSTGTSDIVLGSCYVGELQAEFTGINIAWNGWVGKTLTPTFSLKTGENTWEDVPLGIFKIKQATHTQYGVKIVAYDNMIKFDKKFRKSHFQYAYNGMYPIIETICTDCGVTLANTEAQIEAMPNGDRVLEIYGAMGKKKEFANDITTYRDLLFWVAQSLGCFATINRAGQLVFVQYTQNVVDEIPNNQRLVGATFEDYITHYIGVYFTNLDTNDEDYYGYDSTALQAELNETNEELLQVESDIVQVDYDLVELERKHDAHEITDQEYQQQKAALTSLRKSLVKERKQLQKYVNWLTKALENTDDGADMVMGENPILMDKNLTTRRNSRREVLGALDAISYTPFTASVVYGVIYDLGDVLQFSGGLYNSDTDTFGCVMSWTYNHNLGTDLEGYGVDPAVVQVHNKTQKSVDRANKNAVNAKEISNGTNEPPADAKDGDVYIKRATRVTKSSKYPMSYDTTYVSGTGKIGTSVIRFEEDENGYFDFLCGGLAYLGNDPVTPGIQYSNGATVFKVKLNGAGDYRWSCIVSDSYERRNQATWWAQLGFFMSSQDVTPTGFSGIPGTRPASWEYSANFSDEQNVDIQYGAEMSITSNMLDNEGYIYIWFVYNGAINDRNVGHWVYYDVKDFFIEKKISSNPDVYDGGVNETTEEYIDKVYTFIKDDDDDVGRWVEIERIANITDESWNGLELNYKKYLSLKDYVMRAWYKADPPQVERDFSQFCVRYTGKPDTGLDISYHGGSGWSGTSLKMSDEHVYTIKCGGERRSGEVDYVAYKIEGLVSGKKYYFNFAANIGDSATFGNDTTKGLGVLFNTTGSISSNDWSGEPHTFNESQLYESFYRGIKKYYYDFGFTATASTMYMIVTVADITAGITTSMSITELVVSQEERKYIRRFFLFDPHVKEWLEYKPFGTKDDGGATGVEYLSELNDVSLNNLANGQILEYDSQTGKWVNSDNEGGVGHYADLPDKPSINNVTLSGNKTSSDLGIIITLTQAQYNALSQQEQNDPNKTYYITDASGGGGGGQGVENLSELEDVAISSLSDGQILKYDASVQKWKNVAESSYTLPIAGSNTLGGIKVGDRLSIDQNGVLSANDQSYSLPIAGTNTLGGVKVGQNLSIDQNGVLNATGGSGVSDLDDLGDVDVSSPADGQVLKYNGTSGKWENQTEGGGYTLPTASASTKGGITVNGHGLFMSGTQLKVHKNDYIYTITFESINILSGYGYGASKRYKKTDENIEGCTVFFMGMSVDYGEDANGNRYTKFDKLDIRDCYIRNTTNSSDEEVFDIYGYVFNGTSVSIKKLVIEVYVIIM